MCTWDLFHKGNLTHSIMRRLYHGELDMVRAQKLMGSLLIKGMIGILRSTTLTAVTERESMQEWRLSWKMPIRNRSFDSKCSRKCVDIGDLQPLKKYALMMATINAHGNNANIPDLGNARFAHSGLYHKIKTA